MTAESYARIAVFVLYILVGLSAYRWLIPRLSPFGKALASLMLAAQAIAAGAALFIEFPSMMETWLWQLNHERNIPAILSTLQLALLGFIALLLAWRLRRQQIWRPVYFVGLGILFLYMAYDEYFSLHEYLRNWKLIYGSLGAMATLATLLVAWRSPRNTLTWHAILLIGLAMSAAGAMVIEHVRHPDICSSIVFWNGDECLLYDLEESLEQLGIWIALVALLGQLTALLPTPSIRVGGMFFALAAAWLLILYLGDAFPPLEGHPSHANIEAAQIEFESGLRLHGHRTGKNQKHIHFFLSPGSLDFDGRGFTKLVSSIDLVDQASGVSVLRRNKYVHREFYVVMASRYQPIYRQWIDIERPATIPKNRAYWIVLTLWREDGDSYRRQRILASDHQLLNDTQVILGELVVPAEATPVTPSLAPFAKFNNGFALDAAEWPNAARAAETLSLKFSWRSEVDGSEDLAQFLHLGHAQSGEWWVYDGQPLGPRLPTRLWYPGLADSESWQVPLPADLEPGRYNVFTGLYRLRDLERIPVQSAEGNYFADNRVPMGSLVIE